MTLWVTPHTIPAVVCHRVLIPSTLIPYLPYFVILVECFSLLFTVISQNIRESVHMVEEKMNLNDDVSTNFFNPEIFYQIASPTIICTMGETVFSLGIKGFFIKFYYILSYNRIHKANNQTREYGYKWPRLTNTTIRLKSYANLKSIITNWVLI